mgnify:FL=1
MINYCLKNYKIVLSVVVATICLIAGLYGPVISKMLLTDKTIAFDATNYILIGIGLIFLWGRIRALAIAAQTGISNLLKK